MILPSRRRRPAPAAVAALTALAVASSLLAGASAASAAATPEVLPPDAWLDEFDAPQLHDRWTILGEASDSWSIDPEAGTLTVDTLPGDTHEASNDPQNLFLVDVPVGDFTAVTSFEAPVNQDYQGAGLLVMDDLDNYVRAGMAHVGFAAGGPVVIENALETGGAFGSTFTPRPGSTGETMRVQRVGDTVTTSYWVDGAWVQAAQVTVGFEITQVGLYAFAAGGAEPHTAVFDYFAITPAEEPEPQEPGEPEPTDATLEIDGSGTDIEMSPNLYGIFYEDINYAADGGLYAELVRNRSFEFSSADNGSFNGLTGWQAVARGGASATPTVVGDNGRMNANNRYYLALSTTGAGAGIRNSSYNEGVALEAGAEYEFSVWARTATPQTLTARLEDTAGTQEYGTVSVQVDGSNEWKQYTATLTSTGTTNAARLAVLAGAAGVLNLDMVSLMPADQWSGPVNGEYGLRADLAEMVADLDPSFIRFPGGCVIAAPAAQTSGTWQSYEESNYTNRRRAYHWKETIGPLEERATNFNWWGYNQTFGIGYLEYFMWAEDLGAEPVPVVPVGTNACGGAAALTDPVQLERWVQDTLDLIEFANGNVDTEWGAVRAELGHPEPFDLKYIGLGNEDSQREYFQNYPLFHDAIREAYPDINIVANSSFASGGALFDELWEFAAEQGSDVVDEHFYNDPDWFLANTDRYDSYDREGPAAFIGEYASRGNRFYNALAEAAFLTGVERNSDIVTMASYAPMFANEDYVQWRDANMIYFDNDEAWGTANYYVQRLFSTNRGHEVVPSTLGGDTEVQVPDVSGGVFLSTWATSAEYDNLVVTGADGEPLYAEDFSDGAGDWTPVAGTWQVVDGRYRQTSTSVEDARTVPVGAYEQDWTNYTFELEATKLAGAEGFLIGFAANGAQDFYWWNLGGWGNTRSVFERANGARQGEVVARENVSLVTGQTYDIRVEVEGRTVRAYLDDVLHLEYTEAAPASTLHHVVTRDVETGELIVKVVNSAEAAARTQVSVGDAHLTGTGTVIEMTAESLEATNTKADPTNVVPVERELTGLGNEFTYEFPANSITFLRLGVLGDEASVDLDLAALAIPSSDDVRGNITLPVAGEGGTSFAWASSDPDVVSTSGVVTRPASGQDPQQVTLTVTATKGEVTRTRTFSLTVQPLPEPQEYEAYFFPHFKGESTPTGEQIYFAASRGNDALSWLPLNDDEAVLESSMGEQGLRDPFIIRSHEGDRFYLLATDLKTYRPGQGPDFARAQQSGSLSLIIWESTDLVDWGEPRMVEVNTPYAGNTWAPEAHYVEDLGMYAVYWASNLYDTTETQGRRTRDSYNRMMISYTRDFVTFTDPEVWIDIYRGPGRGMIDSTVVEHEGMYYRFTKDERDDIMEVLLEKSPDLTRPQSGAVGTSWELITERIGSGDPLRHAEGPTAFKANPGDVNITPGQDTWFLFQDWPPYGGGDGYVAFSSTDLDDPDSWTHEPGLDLSARHGTVLPITAAEHRRLLEAYQPDVLGPEVTVEADTRCVAGRVVQTARVTNTSDTTVDVEVSSAYGTRTLTLAPERASAVAFTTRLASVPAGEVSVEASADGATATRSASHAARSCG